jgi:hypothetical protein
LSRAAAMRERAPWWLVVSTCLALTATGCGGRDYDPERMADHVRTNDRKPDETGVTLDRRFWVDKERTREMSVRQALSEMGASLQGGRVLDSAGRELFFFVIHHEYEHPLDPNPGKRRKEEREIQELDKHYRVVRMYIGLPKH